MTLSQRAIETRAVEVLNRAKSLCIPVPVDQVVTSLGVQLHREVLEDEVSGMLVCKGRASHIIVNSKHHPNRQRFTIAHECGHLTLHHLKGDRLFVDTQIRVYKRTGSAKSGVYDEATSSTTPQEEAQANQFASALLMPKELIVKHVKERALDLTDEIGVSTMALAFGVSEQAMSIRLQHVGLLIPA
jgi:Zn-dependent peptidase ImmA (M78 family)